MKTLNEYLVKNKLKKTDKVYKIYSSGEYSEYYLVLPDYTDFKEFLNELNHHMSAAFLNLIKKDYDKNYAVGIRPAVSSSDSGFNIAVKTFNKQYIQFEDYLDDIQNFNIDYWKKKKWM